MPGGLAPGSCQAAFVWNTPIACGVVVPDENGFGWGWTVVLVYALVGGAYIGGGVAYNRFHIGMPLSVEAVPHIDFWREVPPLVKEGITYALSFVQNRLGYSKM